MTARNVTALIRNTGPVPTQAISRPATPGPMIRAAWKEALFRPDGVGQVLARHHLADERLPGGRVDGGGDAEREGERVGVPELDARR